MKKTRKKGIRSLAILLVLVLTLGFSPVTNVEAKAAPRLNYKKVTLVQGKKKRLKVRNLSRRRKVKWYSTKKSVATVNKKGVVKAKKKGKTYIVAKVGKKKYRCKVIVKKKVTKKKKKTKKSNKKVKINKSTKRQLISGKYATRIVGPDGDIYFELNKTEDMFKYLEGAPKTISFGNKVKYYKWYSSNNSILSINKYGIATPKKAGTVKVSCRYKSRYNDWKITKETKITIKDTGDVKISYTTSSSTGDKNKFDTITCTVKNNSGSKIEFDRHVYVDDGTGWMLTSETDKLVPLNSGESTVVVYKITAAWSTLWGKYVDYAGSSYKDPWTIEFGYKLHGKWVSPIHHIRGGEYWSIK